MPGDEMGVVFALGENRMADDPLEVADVRPDAGQAVFPEGADHPGERPVPVLAPDDELRDQGIVFGRDGEALVDARIVPHARAAGNDEPPDPFRARA